MRGARGGATGTGTTAGSSSTGAATAAAADLRKRPAPTAAGAGSGTAAATGSAGAVDGAAAVLRNNPGPIGVGVGSVDSAASAGADDSGGRFLRSAANAAAGSSGTTVSVVVLVLRRPTGWTSLSGAGGSAAAPLGVPPGVGKRFLRPPAPRPNGDASSDSVPALTGTMPITVEVLALGRILPRGELVPTTPERSPAPRPASTRGAGSSAGTMIGSSSRKPVTPSPRFLPRVGGRRPGLTMRVGDAKRGPVTIVSSCSASVGLGGSTTSSTCS